MTDLPAPAPFTTEDTLFGEITVRVDGQDRVTVSGERIPTAVLERDPGSEPDPQIAIGTRDTAHLDAAGRRGRRPHPLSRRPGRPPARGRHGAGPVGEEIPYGPGVVVRVRAQSAAPSIQAVPPANSSACRAETSAASVLDRRHSLAPGWGGGRHAARCSSVNRVAR
ncbi:hypothetical protein ACFVX9_26830 [Kitasatospora sp. NPDC058243]|uniref:hypothetical protein n=1 Tax=Kitasatospora sp. NPDC058243 TaxID=3346397 RepID=UPI0036DAE0EA